ncbi:membrane-spanning 4-domains subfamily A member 5-like isoform X4 [Fukomys damarensis]|uniref:membrane-spanning 4-domains subfamily A member 5-like isoform X4 n=1 Tax=Fukomys damarensis TaxID=885580 RepID=UPI00053F2F46|nr:membrane-spanning 4-domains subfamily A member 5-like isoform X4 [Fukomys damarensis]
MPQNQILIKEEMRILGAIQIMNGLIIQFLGTIWGYLLISQTTALLSVYIPIVTLVGYPFWSTLTFIFSGAFTVVMQKRPSLYTISYAILGNIISSCIAVLGLLLLIFELSVATFLVETSIWQMVHGRRESFSYILKSHHDLSQEGRFSGE